MGFTFNLLDLQIELLTHLKNGEENIRMKIFTILEKEKVIIQISEIRLNDVFTEDLNLTEEFSDFVTDYMEQSYEIILEDKTIHI